MSNGKDNMNLKNEKNQDIKDKNNAPKKRSHKEIGSIMIKRRKINTKISSPVKILDKSLVKHLNEIDLKNNPNFKYYRKLEILGKNYIMSTKTEDVEIRRNLYYYCVNHRTTKTSEIITEKGNKKGLIFAILGLNMIKI